MILKTRLIKLVFCLLLQNSLDLLTSYAMHLKRYVMHLKRYDMWYMWYILWSLICDFSSNSLFLFLCFFVLILFLLVFNVWQYKSSCSTISLTLSMLTTNFIDSPARQKQDCYHSHPKPWQPPPWSQTVGSCRGHWLWWSSCRWTWFLCLGAPWLCPHDEGQCWSCHHYPLKFHKKMSSQVLYRH